MINAVNNSKLTNQSNRPGIQSGGSKQRMWVSVDYVSHVLQYSNKLYWKIHHAIVSFITESKIRNTLHSMCVFYEILDQRCCRSAGCMSVKQSRVPSGGWGSPIGLTSNMNYYWNKLYRYMRTTNLFFITLSKIRPKSHSLLACNDKLDFGANWGPTRVPRGGKEPISRGVEICS